MLVVDEATRERGRRVIHENQATFDEWLKQQNSNAEPDISTFLLNSPNETLFLT